MSCSVEGCDAFDTILNNCQSSAATGSQTTVQCVCTDQGGNIAGTLDALDTCALCQQSGSLSQSSATYEAWAVICNAYSHADDAVAESVASQPTSQLLAQFSTSLYPILQSYYGATTDGTTVTAGASQRTTSSVPLQTSAGPRYTTTTAVGVTIVVPSGSSYVTLGPVSASIIGVSAPRPASRTNTVVNSASPTGSDSAASTAATSQVTQGQSSALSTSSLMIASTSATASGTSASVSASSMSSNSATAPAIATGAASLQSTLPMWPWMALLMIFFTRVIR